MEKSKQQNKANQIVFPVTRLISVFSITVLNGRLTTAVKTQTVVP